MVKKIVAYILLFSMIVSLIVVPVSASGSFGNTITDSSAASALDNYLERQFIVNISLLDFVSAAWNVIDRCFSAAGLDNVHSLDALQAVATRWNQQMNAKSNWPNLLSYIVTSGFDDVPVARVVFDSNFGVYRLQEKYSGLWLVNSAGHFPYYRPETVDDSTGSEIYRTGQWVNMQKVGAQSVLWHVASNYELNEYKEQWSDLYPGSKIMETENYYWFVRSDYYTSYVLCDKYGYPYYLPKEGKTAISTPNNYYQDTTNQYVDEDTINNYYDYENNEYNEYDNSTNVNVMMDGNVLVGQVIDNENGIINVGGKIYYIDQLTYDASTHMYYVDAHDEYVYNSITNNYTTNNYSFTLEYHVSHTSITYIGQTEEYQERYEMYYQLPDGRSSADLTAEDLEQLSFVFKDVVLYARSADNVDLRALYHFDGSVEDSSYWSYATSFDWAFGASLTYLDEGVFNGSLYLDETIHSFNITLPNVTDINGDFTLQFRYYQSHTPAPVLDSYVSLGGVPVLKFDGSYYYDLFGGLLAETSVGNWNELCIMRSDGILYYYVNGVCVASVADNALYSNTVGFLFGMQQQTYKKLDELRFTRAAVYTPGEDYTPSSVPFDTNLALILPDGERPMADEVLVFYPAENNLLGFTGLDGWADYVGARTKVISSDLRGNDFVGTLADGTLLLYNDDYTDFSASGETLTFSVSSDTVSSLVDLGSSFGWYGGTMDVLNNGLFFPLCVYSDSDGRLFPLVSDGTYTFSVVLSDGTCSFATFDVDTSFGVQLFEISNFNSVEGSSVDLNLVSLNHVTAEYNDVFWYAYFTGISIMPTDVSSDVEIMYMELVEGSKPGFVQSWETAMYSSGELADSPVLAVRTNQPIAGYQIGGVRPSYPTKGLVYAMVENSRIVSLQQYTGSAWVAVDGRIWTGERWIPYGSFDVFTLQDFYDVVGGSDDDYEYIYTEVGFWSWFQKQWNKFMDKLDVIIEYITGGKIGSDCDHVYHTQIQREATCAEPGHMLYTCDICSDSYTELIEPVGHDWIVQDHVDDVLDEDGNVVEKGYDIVVCSVCGLESKDYGDGPIESDLFDAIGDLIAESIDWILEKLSQVTDSLSGITDTFNSFVDRVKGMTGEYTLMFGAFLALLPEDLRTLMWLAIVAGIVGLVWKAWAK